MDNKLICNPCVNRKKCKGLCTPLLWINGNVPGREPLAADIRNLPPETTHNYNDVLSEIIEDRRNRMHNISNIRRRAITALLLADISRSDISTLLSMSYRQVLRLANNTK